jgi:two-component system, cell cycle response regulator
VVLVTALDQPSDRVRGLEGGGRRFPDKPVNDLALISRVRSLARLKMVTDELRMRAITSREIGIDSGARDDRGNGPRRPHPDRGRSRELLRAHRGRAVHRARRQVGPAPAEALFRVAEGDYEVVIVSLALDNFDGLRLCSQIR